MLIKLREWNLIYLIIPASLIIDLINGAYRAFFLGGIRVEADLSIGVVFRGILSIFLLRYISWKSWVGKFGLFAIFSFVLSNWVWSLRVSNYNPFFELSIFLKTIYAISVTCYLASRKRPFHHMDIAMLSFGLAFSSAMIFSFITGIGIETYGDFSFGIKSFFIAQNDISLSALIALVWLQSAYPRTGNKLYLIGALSVSIGSFLLGTRAGMGGTIMIWLAFAFGLLFLRPDTIVVSRTTRWAISGIVLFLSIGGIYAAVRIISEYDYMLRKFDIEAVSGISAREWMVLSAIQVIKQYTLIEHIFGLSSYGFFVRNSLEGTSDGMRTLLVEVDYLDIYGSYGILGLCYLLLPITMLIKGMRKFLNIHDTNSYFGIVALIVFIGHSALAGHALMSPVVGSVISVVYFSITTSEKKCQITQK